MCNKNEHTGVSLYKAAQRLNIPFKNKTKPRSHKISVGHLGVHYLEWGDRFNPSILLLHGIAQQAHSWDFISLSLSDNYHVIALDARGHGDSAWPVDGDYSLETFQQDLDKFIEKVGLKDFVVIGHSLGGRNAYVLASRQPNQLRGLVIVDTGPTSPHQGQNRIRRFINLPDELDTPEEFAMRIQEYTGRPLWMIFGSLKNSLRQLDNGKWSWKYDKAIRATGFSPPTWSEEQLRRQLTKIPCPTLVVRGDHSDVLSDTTFQTMLELIPHSKGIVVPHAGHLVPGDNPVGFLEAVRPFLEELTENAHTPT